MRSLASFTQWGLVLQCVTAAIGASVPSVQGGEQATGIRYVNPWWHNVTSGPMLVTMDVAHNDSPLLFDIPYGLKKRKAIDVYNAVVTTVGTAGTSVLAAAAGITLYRAVARDIKDKSDANSCTLFYANVAGDGVSEGIWYEATTTGSNCDTTALYETILNGVNECADSLHNGMALRGCCDFDHGGTWHGHLRVSRDNTNYPAADAVCPGTQP